MTNRFERFWSKVDIKGQDDCWEWLAAKDDCGYGKFADGRGGFQRSHRIIYHLCKGIIPSDMKVCHSCDNPSCCNPNHLWLGTHQENMDDMTQKKRAWGTRLDEEKVRSIRTMIEQGSTHSKVSLLFGISGGHVNRIINRVCWKHVP